MFHYNYTLYRNKQSKQCKTVYGQTNVKKELIAHEQIFNYYEIKMLSRKNQQLLEILPSRKIRLVKECYPSVIKRTTSSS